MIRFDIPVSSSSVMKRKPWALADDQDACGLDPGPVTSTRQIGGA
jgi:hypothetical protein